MSERIALEQARKKFPGGVRLLLDKPRHVPKVLFIGPLRFPSAGFLFVVLRVPFGTGPWSVPFQWPPAHFPGTYLGPFGSSVVILGIPRIPCLACGAPFGISPEPILIPPETIRVPGPGL